MLKNIYKLPFFNREHCKKNIIENDIQKFIEEEIFVEYDELEEYSINDDKTVKPFLKWAGGKFKSLNDIKNLFPKNGKTYLEPFVGAGSIALNVDYEKIIVNDINSDLIQVYLCLQKDGIKFINECKKIFTKENNTRESYKKIKDEFNTSKDIYRKAVLFIYLNRHCFNGLCRYNRKGEFNTPIGKYGNPYFPESQMFSAIEKIEKFEIKNEDYKNIIDMAMEGDIVYCDPPYIPLSESAYFDAYSKEKFTLKNQIELAESASMAAERGAIVLISNHCNWYSRQIYTEMYGGKVKMFDVSRTISSNIEQRKAVKELIATFSPKK